MSGYMQELSSDREAEKGSEGRGQHIEICAHWKLRKLDDLFEKTSNMFYV